MYAKKFTDEEWVEIAKQTKVNHEKIKSFVVVYKARYDAVLTEAEAVYLLEIKR